jgi:hypothetical protein
MANERGLVISSPVEISGRSLNIKNSDLDPQELRFSLLFWDKLNFPTNNIINLGLNDDSQFLAETKILERLHVTVGGAGDMAQAFQLAHVHAFKTFDQMQPGVWSLATGENSISFLDGDLEMGRGILVRLYQAIPVPNKDVPLQDILEFREKYRAELLALRHHLDAIYQRILAAGDGALALNSELSALESAIADYIKTARAVRFPFVGMSFDASLNVPAAVAAGMAAFETGLGGITSLLAGAAAGFAVGPTASLKKHKDGQIPFRYISSYNERVF